MKPNHVHQPNPWTAVWENGRILALVKGKERERMERRIKEGKYSKPRTLREWGVRWQAEAKEESNELSI